MDSTESYDMMAYGPCEKCGTARTARLKRHKDHSLIFELACPRCDGFERLT